MQNKMKIAIGASSGGHMNELLEIINSGNCDNLEIDHLICTKPINPDALNRYYTIVDILGECNRGTPWQIIKVFFSARKALSMVCPDILISTGALPLAIYAYLAKKRRCKIIWIDSIANVTTLSMSGKFVKKFADRFYIQWPELIKFNAAAVYKGRVI